MYICSSILAGILDKLEKKKEHYSNFCTFEIATLLNVPEHYLRIYGICYQTDKLFADSQYFVKT